MTIDYADLVKRLRTIAPTLPNDKGFSTTVPQAVLRAADHIEALVKERDGWEREAKIGDRLVQEANLFRQAAEAEAAKLKEALTKIADRDTIYGTMPEIARRALEGK